MCGYTEEEIAGGFLKAEQAAYACCEDDDGDDDDVSLMSFVMNVYYDNVADLEQIDC